MMEAVLEILIRPDDAFDKIRNGTGTRGLGRFVAQAWLCLLLGALVWTGRTMSLAGMVVWFLLGSLIILVGLSVKSGALHLCAQMAGGRGAMSQFTAMLALCTAPLYLCLPVALVFGRGLSFLVPICWIALASWCGVLGFKALRRNYRLSAPRAIMAGLAPAVILTLMTFAALAMVLIITVIHFVTAAAQWMR